ncbi:MAG: N-acetylmuramic acid 6-phosphate etherase [Armatimonadota bacterium]|nr:N-acetylmuramic acid 6-phosphate etherase [Armatimonadota bacterium]MDR7450748.1 N-acetylmuramic acid 6-phosphate etherase [Armatimonadota bacterium]MDR7466104.1 N-acetylmuramic acid 6-phosphate etherase [Armatimonadota bacterium]MDR7493859.1 N-acetylmuramic acid 6-phosphate etherase [Armatimonadota bacterium]MDR7498980.1 N-acetylmuramic acid 6-phosphate etherase [Armatimonadota bacterium]
MSDNPSGRNDFGDLVTERRNPRSMRLDVMSTAEIVALINDEDATVAAAVRGALPEIARAADLIADRLRRGGRLFYVGAGTSGRIAMLDAAEWTPTFGTDPGLVRAVVAGGAEATIAAASALEDDAEQGAQDLAVHDPVPSDVVVGIAASGRTPYVLGALRKARAAGAATIALCSNANTPMAEEADLAIVVLTGPEVLTGSTRMKAGTAQKMVLNMLSTAAMVRLGKVYSNLMVDMVPANEKLLHRARRIVAEAAGVSPAQAAQVLEAAGNHVKTAIVMAVLRCGRDEARAALERAGGMVRIALEARRP